MFFDKITVADVTVHAALSLGVDYNLRTAMNGISIYKEMPQREGGWCEPFAGLYRTGPGASARKCSVLYRVKGERVNRT